MRDSHQGSANFSRSPMFDAGSNEYQYVRGKSQTSFSLLRLSKLDLFSCSNFNNLMIGTAVGSFRLDYWNNKRLDVIFQRKRGSNNSQCAHLADSINRYI